MNKELTPLEAFQLFCKELKIKNSEFAKTIEAALKRQDSIEITAIDIEQENQALCKENKKFKRVLEIIKEKKVNVGNFIYWLKSTTNPTYESYLLDYYQEGWNIHFNDGVSREYDNSLYIETYCLTQEEFDLLKEVLVK